MSKIKDLVTGKLSNQIAGQFLLELNEERLNAALINEVISSVIEANENSDYLQALHSLNLSNELIDCCGTGGSGLPHYNVSTITAFILASGGVKVAKFGNRSASSGNGSFDFLECLGINTDLTVEKIPDFLEQTNLIFLFAPQFYPSLASLSPIRKSLSVATIFNIIGPLLNPLRPFRRILGTKDKTSQKAIADYLLSYTSNEDSFVATAESGLDEIDPASITSVLRVNPSGITETSYLPIMPDKIILKQSLTPIESALQFKELITNANMPDTYFHSLIVTNAAAGFLLSGKVKTLENGKEMATMLLQSGQVRSTYEKYRSLYV